jgi:hypothetical protein
LEEEEELRLVSTILLLSFCFLLLGRFDSKEVWLFDLIERIDGERV